MVRPHHEALRATAPFWLDRVFRAVESIRSPRKSGSHLALRDAVAVGSGGRASKAGSPALTPLALHHRHRPDPCFTGCEGGRAGRMLEWGRASGLAPGKRQRASAVQGVGLALSERACGERSSFTGRSVTFQGGTG